MSRRTTHIILLVLAIGAVGLFVFSGSRENTDTQQQETREVFTYATTTVTVGTTTIIADIADTPAKRTRGLSGRTTLPEGRGMLFVFDKPDTYSFWMKDMHFPIDIIWMNAEKEVVHIARNATPDSYPQTFAPLAPAQYVLETNPGAINDISVEETVRID